MVNLVHSALRHQSYLEGFIMNLLDMDKERKRLDKQAERYRQTHCTKYVCPFCDTFLVPWSWSWDVNQYTCKCNAKKMKGSPSWYQIIRGNSKSDWSFSNGTTWFNPVKIPILFNPSVRQK